ncbi:MAG TPA: hypothetical protein VKR43_10535 [Bryobacteraceae bacterium]|nr:hypothetical protein [Bryobacteraceae bacterium]
MSAAKQGLNDLYLQQHTQAPTLDPIRNGLRREGSNIFDITQSTVLLERTQDRMRRDIEALRAHYVFTDESVTHFLSRHSAFPTVLSNAIEPLREFFGTDKVFRLEVSTDEDEPRTFYVVVRWTGTPESAAEAIDRFDDAWWLEHMTPAVSNLSFTCDFA